MSIVVFAIWGAQLFVYLGEILLNAPSARRQSTECNLEIMRALDTVPVFYYAPRPAVKKATAKAGCSEVTL